MSIEHFVALQDAAHRPGPVLPEHPDWMKVACGCCAGVEWGGEPPPRECRDCGGSGIVFVHRSGVVAQYPGGPFNGDRRPECWARFGAEDSS